MAGTADIGIPYGMPVDEWGIRVAAGKVLNAWRAGKVR